MGDQKQRNNNDNLYNKNSSSINISTLQSLT